MNDTYIVCGCKPWCKKVFDEAICGCDGDWEFAENTERLNYLLKTADIFFGDTPIKYIFFMHWNDIVPREITDNYICINFHMTDLPYGRGGSPLQNLILEGNKATKVTAHRMRSDIDCGEIILKRGLILNGTAEEIYLRANYIMAGMIGEMLSNQEMIRHAEPQFDAHGIEAFRRRTPEQSRITTDIKTLGHIHNHIRMLDAETYPPAFINVGNLRFEFKSSCKYMDRVEARVVITEDKNE